MTNFPESLGIQHADKLFIDGGWRTSKGNEKLQLISPVTEQIFAEVAAASKQDVDDAAAAARHAFDHGPWPRMAPTERANLIIALAHELDKRSDQLAAAWTEQIGAPIAYTKATTPPLIGFYKYYASLAESFPWSEEKNTVHTDHIGVLAYEPVGVAATIIPWNGPFFTMTIKVAPALMAGCTLLIKPSPETPLEALIFAECAQAAGIPPGVINVLPAGRDVSEYLVRKQEVDKVSITGSTAAGKKVAAICAERVARVTLELGGKSAAIILDDYDLDKAASNLAPTICRMTGQVCSNLTRHLVPKDKHDAYVAALAREMDAIRVGDPHNEDTFMGPVAMKRQLERIEEYVAIGKSEGAELITGGKRLEQFDTGYYYAPTLFANVDNSSRLAQEEIFGPVIAVTPYDDIEEAVAIANDSNFGLNGAVFTNDVNTAYSVSRRIRTGSMGHNGSKSDFMIGFGGFKQSGIGREGGEQGLMPYLEAKTIVLEARPDGLNKKEG